MPWNVAVGTPRCGQHGVQPVEGVHAVLVGGLERQEAAHPHVLREPDPEPVDDRVDLARAVRGRRIGQEEGGDERLDLPGPGLQQLLEARALGEGTAVRGATRRGPERQEGDGGEEASAGYEEGHAYDIHRPGGRAILTRSIRAPRPAADSVGPGSCHDAPHDREDAMTSPAAPTPELKRSFGLVTLVAFGIGDILGAGIYGLIGDVARDVGNAVWASFLVAFVVAAFTGLSYAELGIRLPHSGGEARYAETAFKRHWLAYLVGFLVLLSGLVSISTVSHIFAEYLQGGLLPGVAELAHPRRLPDRHRRHRLLGHPAVLGGQRRLHAGRGGRPADRGHRGAALLRQRRLPGVPRRRPERPRSRASRGGHSSAAACSRSTRSSASRISPTSPRR